MTRRSASSLEVLVAVLAFLSILVFRVEMVESGRILRTSIPSDANPFPPPPPGPDGRNRLGKEEPPPMRSSSASRNEMESSVAGAGAAGTHDKLTVDRLRKLFGAMLPRGSTVPPAGIPSPIHN